MKNLKSLLLASFLTIGTFSTVLFTSCNPDNCKSVVCNNGGTCNDSDGSCNCAVGFEGSNCDTESRTKLIGNYLLNGSDNLGNTYSNLAATTSNSGVDKKKFSLNISGTFILNCTMTSTSAFTIDNATINGFTYSGSGNYQGTTLTITINEADAAGTTIYNFNGNKQ
ncbi:MAG TPA: calcium-binding EGF-like domain-containing protein [Chitinophagaceae bacterium]|nr:calcium-binding EGF-like domain-containing protein [Chitinophagaceae bacterium]